MKYLLGIASVLCLFGISAAQCPAPANAKTLTIPASGSSRVDLSTLGTRQAVNDEESLFKATGPKLFKDMDEANSISNKTGLPVVCWMGPHLFADPRARAVSRKLGNTTIQGVMDGDGSEGTIGADGKPIPVLRVKFTDKNYAKGARTAYIPLDKFDETTAEKILQFARGGK